MYFAVNTPSAELHAQALLCVQTHSPGGRWFALLDQPFDHDNWARMCKPLMAWHIVDRSGDLQALKMPPAALDGAEPPQLHEPPGAFQINDTELDLLLDASQPDVLINTLFEQIPDVLPTGADQAKVHAWVRRACDLATQHGLEATDEQLALAATACLTEGRVLDDPALPGVLAGHRPGQGSLADALAALLPEEADAAP